MTAEDIDNLDAWMRANHWSNSRLAAALGVHTNTIHRWRNDVPLTRILRLALWALEEERKAA
jgi:plasmid maintenance system antidote protein VapI